MKVPALLLLIVIALIAAFVMLNWSAILAPAEVFIGVTTVHAPIGLVMLALLVLLAASFLVFIMFLQTSALLESRRQSRELKANREIADKAEASRFTELRGLIESEMRKQAEAGAAAHAALLERVAQLERELRRSVEESGNTLASYIGEVEDRLEHGSSRPGGG